MFSIDKAFLQVSLGLKYEDKINQGCAFSDKERLMLYLSSAEDIGERSFVAWVLLNHVGKPSRSFSCTNFWNYAGIDKREVVTLSP